MTEQENRIHQFLTGAFYTLLRQQENALKSGRFGNLSISELHTLEVIGDLRRTEKAGSMRAAAEALNVTAGTLSVSVSTLAKKGYLCKERAAADRRVVRLRLTPDGEEAYEEHKAFHRRLVRFLNERLCAEDLAGLTRALALIEEFFSAPNAGAKQEETPCP